MKRFMTTLSVFMASIPFASAKTDVLEDAVGSADQLEPVSLRPLNNNLDNMFAAHRSHSSHSSHRSSSGGGSYRSPTPTLPPSRNESNNSGSSLYGPPGSSQAVDPGRPTPVSPSPEKKAPTPLTRSEKLILQVMRVQIALTSLEIYSGSISGNLDENTKESIRRFQVIKGIEPNGLMSTETLNALGVPAVQ